MIKVNNLTFNYPGKTAPALLNIDLEVSQGEFVLITGPTGCGKSTLLKCLNGIIPHESEGIMSGNVIIDGVNTDDASLPVLSRKVGMVQQNPDDQIFSLIVEDEVAFGPENLSLSIEKIEQRVALALKQVGMAEFRQKSVHTLSGGQKQRVAIAAILSMQPSVLLLDEPASQLDPLGTEEILSVITKINAEKKSTIVLVEHRIHEVVHLADRIIIMDKGTVILDAGKKEVFENHIDIFHKLGLRVPETIELFHQLKLSGVPLTEKEALHLLKKRVNSYKSKDTKVIHDKKLRKEKKIPVLKTEDVWFAYEEENWILQGINLEIWQGELIALLGNNGSGKSTLLLHMCGILKPQRGNVKVLGRKTRHVKPESMVGDVAVVFQDPALMLFCDTVWKEVAFGPENLKIEREEIKKRVQEALNVMTVEDLTFEPPQALSGGQRLRAAVASVLSLEPRILLLDEPTSGQDKRNIVTFMNYLKELSGNNITCVFITHDMETALKFADRVMVLDNGSLIANGTPGALFENMDLFNKTSLKPPQALTLSTQLGLTPSFCVYDLAETLKAMMTHV